MAFFNHDDPTRPDVSKASRSRKLAGLGALLVLSSGIPAVTGATGLITDPILPSSIQIRLTQLAGQYVAPVGLTHAGDGSDRLFVNDQHGVVHLLKTGVQQATPFLDVRSRLPQLGLFGTQTPMGDFDERGLLGLAFHPDFANNGKLYTYTSEVAAAGTADFPLSGGVPINHQSVIAEWQVDPSNPDVVNVASRRELLRIDQPQFNHNGGTLRFSPNDGSNLYIALGDGGNSRDVGPGHTPGVGNGQDNTNILGSILRIDVDGSNGANGQYGVPVGNPFAGADGIPNEIFAYGLRNPWQISFDNTGRFIVPDVGQGSLEEINIVEAGDNLGWNRKEGTYLFDPTTGTVMPDLAGLPGLKDPILQYDRDEGTSVTGGFVYRGTAIPELVGKYVFGDFTRGGFFDPLGRLFAADLDTLTIEELLLPVDTYVKSFGVDASGEIYLLGGINLGPFTAPNGETFGAIYRIDAVPLPAAVWMLASALGVLGLRRKFTV